MSDANHDDPHTPILEDPTSNLDPLTRERITGEIYSALHGIAERFLRKERVEHTLQPTALVHEAYLRLGSGVGGKLDRPQFLALAASAMRHILVDHSRRRSAAKRGKREPGVTLSGEPEFALGNDAGLEVLELEDLLGKLQSMDARKARVVELKLFAGMSLDEIADALKIARSTVAADWAIARAWLTSQWSGSAKESP